MYQKQIKSSGQSSYRKIRTAKTSQECKYLYRFPKCRRIPGIRAQAANTAQTNEIWNLLANLNANRKTSIAWVPGHVSLEEKENILISNRENSINANSKGINQNRRESRMIEQLRMANSSSRNTKHAQTAT